MLETVALPRWGFWASLWFWGGVVRESLRRLRLSRVLERRLARRAIVATGTHHVPTSGSFVFCVNHYHAGLTLDVVSATLLAAARTRPRIGDECTIIVGHRVRNPASRLARVVRWLVRRFFARWGANVLRVQTGSSATMGLAELRAWRERAMRAPSLVFPEGVANGELGSMRAGVGSFLSGLEVPVVPVGVWWDAREWKVTFGAPLVWSSRRDLRDLQLGLAMAELLPETLASKWSELLARWRAAHAARYS